MKVEEVVEPDYEPGSTSLAEALQDTIADATRAIHTDRLREANKRGLTGIERLEFIILGATL